ncbi:MAG: DUF3995 domain-containing protein [Thermoleophilia bacterium]|nr:DUF3995 domain-containing protein [Thermoleophilia bacterium]
MTTAARRAAARATAAALAGAAILHAAWAAGSTFPESSGRALAELVIGDGDRMPPSGLTWAVAAGLATGAVVVAERARARVLAAPWERMACRAGRLVAVVLAVRGVGGLMTSGLGLVDEASRFRVWNLALYSPLCLLLAAGAAAVWTRPSDAGPAEDGTA